MKYYNSVVHAQQTTGIYLTGVGTYPSRFEFRNRRRKCNAVLNVVVKSDPFQIFEI